MDTTFIAIGLLAVIIFSTIAALYLSLRIRRYEAELRRYPWHTQRSKGEARPMARKQ